VRKGYCMSARSYRPRHRRPSKAKPALAVTTMSTAFILAGSPSAHAASSDDFARLRQCESGSNYSINSGNGFYGAYQFDLQTWHGLGYSGLPSNASKSTQDAAAHVLQASRGWQPWPSCSRQLGLRRGSGSTKSTASTDTKPADTSPAQSGASAFSDATDAARASAATFEVLPVGTVLVPPTPPVQPFAIDVTGTPREDVRMWQEQMAKRGWDIVVDGFHGEESVRVAAAFIEAKGLVQTPGHTMTEILWNATWENPVT
jgi:hypothetical protein